MPEITHYHLFERVKKIFFESSSDLGTCGHILLILIKNLCAIIVDWQWALLSNVNVNEMGVKCMADLPCMFTANLIEPMLN